MELIKIVNYSMKYKNKEILKNVNISFNAGNVYLIEGENGSGKSSFIKSLIGIERANKQESGSITYYSNKNILLMNGKEIQQLRSEISYLEQKDDYENFRNVSVIDVLKDSYQAHINRKLTKEDVNYIVDLFSKYSKYCTFTLKTKVNKLSGGQQRLLSIIAYVCLRKDSRVFLIDEPLNNLDINTVASVSNILNSMVKEKTDSVFIIITHCKIFPFVNRAYKIENLNLVDGGMKITCHTCFGNPDEHGYYL